MSYVRHSILSDINDLDDLNLTDGQEFFKKPSGFLKMKWFPNGQKMYFINQRLFVSRTFINMAVIKVLDMRIDSI